jgi:hypothetical protein
MVGRHDKPINTEKVGGEKAQAQLPANSTTHIDARDQHDASALAVRIR